MVKKKKKIKIVHPDQDSKVTGYQPPSGVTFPMGWCTKCRLCEHSQANKVSGIGPTPCKVMIVGEALGKDEEKAQKPFVGPSGQLLNETLGMFGWHREQIYVTNMVRCRPYSEHALKSSSYKRKQTSTQRWQMGKENRTPKADEVSACAAYLDEEIKLVQPNVIIPLGNVPTKYLLGRAAPITSVRGVIQWSDKYQAKVIPTFHPAALLHAPRLRPLFRQDIKNALLEAGAKEQVNTARAVQYELICGGELEKALKAIEKLQADPVVAVDVETSGFDSLRSKIISIGLSGQPHTGVAIQLNDAVGKRLWSDEQLIQLHNALDKLFRSDSIKIAHNIKFELRHLAQLNLFFGPNTADTQIMHQYLAPDDSHDLIALSTLYTDMGKYDEPLEVYKRENPKCKESYALIPFEILGPYNCADVDCTLRSYLFMKPLMQNFKVLNEYSQEISFNVWEPFVNYTMPATRVISYAERCGIQIDWDLLVKRHHEVSAKLDEARIKFYAAANTDTINLNSPKQLQCLFFEKLGLPKQKETATGQSTDDEVLKALAPLHPSAEALLEYRKMNKLWTTYILGIRNAVLFGQNDSEFEDDVSLWDKDEVIRREIKTNWLLHPQFHMAGTRTGRLSSSNPLNAQNMPRGPLIRNLIISKYEGGQLIAGDLNQAEVRVMASEAKDSKLISYFLGGKDLHRMVASEVFKKLPEEITKEERSKAKSVTFGVAYGRSAHTLAQEFGMEIEEAEKFMHDYFSNYRELYYYKQGEIQKAHQRGWVKTIFGRIRKFEDINHPDKKVREHVERTTFNFPIQSAASDITLAAATRIYGELRQRSLKAHLILTVHDSLLYDTPPEEVDVVMEIVKRQMEISVPGLLVPMVADVKKGYCWEPEKED